MEYKSNGHTRTKLAVHIVLVTKYRYAVLKGDIQLRMRDLIKQVCDSNDVRIIKGVVGKDHIHLHVEYSPKVSISKFLKILKGSTSRKIQQEFKELSKRYWGKHFWAIGYGAWSTGVVSEDLINNYLEHHRSPSNFDVDNFILE